MYRPVPDETLKSVVDAKQLHAAYLDAKREAKRNAPKLTWESRGEFQYLISTLHSHGTKIRKSLGPRTAETEAIYETRSERRALAMERWAGLQQQYARQVRINLPAPSSPPMAKWGRWKPSILEHSSFSSIG